MPDGSIDQPLVAPVPVVFCVTTTGNPLTKYAQSVTVHMLCAHVVSTCYSNVG